MSRFTDSAGRTWTVAINVETVKRVRSLCGVDLLDIVDGKLIERLYSDPILLCDVVYAVCKPEADAIKVSDEDFGRAMAGDAIEAATAAVLDDLVDFFPSRQHRENLRKVLTATRSVATKAEAMVTARLDSGLLESIEKQALASVGNSFTAAPESSALTPTG